MIIVVFKPWIVQRSSLIFRSQYIVLHFPFVRLGLKFCIYIPLCTCKFILHQGRGIQCFKEVHVYSLVRFSTCTCTSPYWNMTLFKVHMGDFQKNEDFSFSENNFNIKRYERKVNILKQAQW